jgi:hypothetical protein
VVTTRSPPAELGAQCLFIKSICGPRDRDVPAIVEIRQRRKRAETCVSRGRNNVAATAIVSRVFCSFDWLSNGRLPKSVHGEPLRSRRPPGQHDFVGAITRWQAAYVISKLSRETIDRAGQPICQAIKIEPR